MSRNRYENPSHKTYDDLFGDDFEVVYEEELPPIRPNDTFPEKDTGSLDNEWDDITDKWADDYDSTWDDDTEDGWDDDIESSNSKKKKSRAGLMSFLLLKRQYKQEQKPYPASSG